MKEMITQLSMFTDELENFQAIRKALRRKQSIDMSSPFDLMDVIKIAENKVRTLIVNLGEYYDKDKEGVIKHLRQYKEWCRRINFVKAEEVNKKSKEVTRNS